MTNNKFRIFIFSLFIFYYEALLTPALSFVYSGDIPFHVLATAFLGLGAAGLTSQFSVRIWPEALLTYVLFLTCACLYLWQVDLEWIFFGHFALFFVLARTIFSSLQIEPSAFSVLMWELCGAILGVLIVAVAVLPLGVEGLYFILLIALGSFLILNSKAIAQRVLSTICLVIPLAFLMIHLFSDRFDVVKYMPNFFQSTQALKATLNVEMLKKAQHIGFKWSYAGRTDVWHDISNNKYWLLFNNHTQNNILTSQDTADGGLVKAIKPGKTFSIGVAGGGDLRELLSTGISDIEAAEVSASTYNLMTNQMAELSDYIYKKGRVHLIDGRTWIANSPDKYDLIFFEYPTFEQKLLGSTINPASQLFTVEAFKSYQNQLTPNGILFVVIHLRDDIPAMQRILNTLSVVVGKTELGQRALLAAMRIRQGGKPEQVDNYGILLLKNGPWNASEVSDIRKQLWSTQRSSSTILWNPMTQLSEDTNLNAAEKEAVDILKNQFPDQIVQTSGSGKLISPTYDNKPTFFIYDGSLSPFVAAGSSQIAILVFAGLFLILEWIIVISSSSIRIASTSALAAFLGIGFGLLQSFFSQFIGTVLGDPAYPLLAILIGVSVPSIFGLWLGKIAKLKISCLLVMVLCVGLLVIAQFVDIFAIRQFLPNQFGIAIICALAFPISVVLSMLFPNQLQLIKNDSGKISALSFAWNCVFCVLGLFIGRYWAVTHGISEVLLFASSVYLAIATLQLIASPRA